MSMLCNKEEPYWFFSVPRSLDVRQKAAWVSLLFLMKLYNKGKEYAKVQLHDS